MSKQQYHILDPRTNRKLSVSKDVYNTVARNNETEVNKQKELTNKLKTVNEQVSRIKYIAQAKDMTIAVNFTDKGQVDEFSAPVYQLGEDLSKSEQELVQRHLQQLVMCINDALNQKASDTEAFLKKTIEELKQAS